MDAAFEKALQKIPPQLRERPGTRFTAILSGQKKPEGKDWAGVNGANYSIHDLFWLDILARDITTACSVVTPI
jgi:hypothetical protein